MKHRWDAIQQANDEMEEAKLAGVTYEPFRYANGDTRKELLIRSRYCSSLQTSGQKGKSKGQAFFLMSIPT